MASASASAIPFRKSAPRVAGRAVKEVTIISADWSIELWSRQRSASSVGNEREDGISKGGPAVRFSPTAAVAGRVNKRSAIDRSGYISEKAQLINNPRAVPFRSVGAGASISSACSRVINRRRYRAFNNCAHKRASDWVIWPGLSTPITEVRTFGSSIVGYAGCQELSSGK